MGTALATDASTVAATSPRSWPLRALAALDRVVTGLLLAAVALMVTVVSTQVLLRYGFNRSIDWADEIGRLAFVWAIFLAIPLGVRDAAHIGIDLAVEKLPPAWRGALRRGGSALSAAMMIAIAWVCVGVAREQWDEMMATVDLSVGWFILPVGIGAALSALHLLRFTITGVAAVRAGSAE